MTNLFNHILYTNKNFWVDHNSLIITGGYKGFLKFLKALGIDKNYGDADKNIHDICGIEHMTVISENGFESHYVWNDKHYWLIGLD